MLRSIRLWYLSVSLRQMDKPSANQLSFSSISWKEAIIRLFLILVTIAMFLVGVDLMVASLNLLDANTMEIIVRITSNPFTALFIGLLITAIIQSSSATTSMTVALVASGSVGLEHAVPLIMGANIGTTITSTFVSLGFISMGKEYKRAVAASTSHDFFNILTVAIIFPLEYNFKFLSKLSGEFAAHFSNPTIENGITQEFSSYSVITKFLSSIISNEYILIGLSFLLLLVSVLLFRKIIAGWLGVKTKQTKKYFKNVLYAFLWGLFSTAIIRSSTITTSVVVPLVGKRLIKLKAAFFFIMGANIGTTVTAFIAAFTSTNSAISIAFAHFLFNCIGVLIFSIPMVREVPLLLAKGLGRMAYRYRITILLYILLIFFIIPFALILLNK